MTRRPICLVCLLLMTVMCAADWLGFSLIQGNPLPETVRKWIYRHPESAICGEVERCTSNENSQSVYLKHSYLIYDSKKFPIENVRVFLKEKEEKLPVGMQLFLTGSLEEVQKKRNPGEFDSRNYYACSHIYYFMKDGIIKKKSVGYWKYGEFLVRIRERLLGALKDTAGKEAPVLQAIVLGDKSDLETETKMRYQMAGIIHMLAISGLHISVLGVGLYELLKKAGLGIKLSGMLSLIVMIQYGMMTGGNVSTMRAVCMFLLSVGAKLLGRIYDMLTALSVTAVLLLLESPAYLYNSGFLLSFGAVLGIGAVTPAVLKIFGVKNRVGKALTGSLCVQLTTLPVMLYFFGEVSVAGIFLNLVVLPTVGAALGSGVAAALLGCFWTGGGMAAALPGRLLLMAYERLCILAGRLPLCTWVGGALEPWQTAVYYGLLAVFLALGLSRRKKEEKRKLGCSRFRRIIYMLLPAVGLLVLGFPASPYLRITCLDVGQGDAIVIKTPEGICFLTDGGSLKRPDVGQYQLLPFLKNQGISRIDGVFVSHTDEDHINGVRQLLEFQREGVLSVKIRCLYLPEWENPPEAWTELAALAQASGVKVQAVRQGDTLCAGELRIRFLAPEKGSRGENVNEEAMVFQVDYRDFSGLFTGDIGRETEKKLLPLLEDTDLLKVGHHGSKNSSSQEFLEKIRPEYAAISCSENNTYGHPSPDTVRRLEAIGCRVEYTMKSGAVTFITDGKRIGVKRFFGCSS